jgi:hypothetical protein
MGRCALLSKMRKRANGEVRDSVGVKEGSLFRCVVSKGKSNLKDEDRNNFNLEGQMAAVITCSDLVLSHI